MSRSLVEIPVKQWPELRDLYGELKNMSSSYNTIQCFIDWKAQNKNVDIKILTLDDGEWRKDGTYIGMINNNIPCILINTLNENQQRLLEALNALKMNKSYTILGYPERLSATVAQHWVDVGFEREHLKPKGVAWHHIEKEKVEKFAIDIPPGFSLRRLETKHAELMDSVWPLRAPGSVSFVELLITYNENVGVFDREDNLVAWCLILPIGGLGPLMVLDAYKGLGLGNLAARYLAKQVAAKGLEVTAPALVEKAASLGLYKKLGFNIVEWANIVVIPIEK